MPDLSDSNRNSNRDRDRDPNVGGVFVALEGGLGNHLFQAAMGLATCARLNGAPLVLSSDSLGFEGRLSHLANCGDPELRAAASERGAAGNPLVRAEMRRRMHADTVFKGVGTRASGPPPGAAVAVHRESDDDWGSLLQPTPPPWLRGGWLMLAGYFQSERHWDGVREAAVAPLARNVREYAESVMASLPPARLPRLEPGACVALHVRRGDYVGNSVCAALDPDAYYPPALEEVARRAPDAAGAPLLVFTNDRAWCEREWAFLRGRPHEFVDTGDDVADLHIMSLCAHKVIANSTFSWWGAYLGSNGVVVAPRQWFKAGCRIANWEKIYATGWSVV
jgi:hypothetical protein